jgi:hypothetical protein
MKVSLSARISATNDRLASEHTAIRVLNRYKSSMMTDPSGKIQEPKFKGGNLTERGKGLQIHVPVVEMPLPELKISLRNQFI